MVTAFTWSVVGNSLGFHPFKYCCCQHCSTNNCQSVAILEEKSRVSQCTEHSSVLLELIGETVEFSERARGRSSDVTIPCVTDMFQGKCTHSQFHGLLVFLKPKQQQNSGFAHS